MYAIQGCFKQESKRKRVAINLYMFSGRGKNLNDQKQNCTIVFQISNTFFLGLHQNLSVFFELTNQYVHFVPLHIASHWN